MGNRFLILLCVSVGVVLSRPSGQAVPEVNTQRQDVVRAEDDPFILALPVKHKDAQTPGTANQIEPSDAVSDKSPDEQAGDDLIISVDPEAAQRAADDLTVSQAVADGQGNNENEAHEETAGIQGEVDTSPSQVDDVEFSETAHANEEVGLSAAAAEENEQGTVAENAAQQPVDEGVTAEETFAQDQVSNDHQEGVSEKSLDQAIIGEQNAADITFVEKVPRGQEIPAELITSAVEASNVATLIEEEEVPAEAAAVEEQNIAESTDVETQEAVFTETAAAEASEVVQNDAESAVAEETAAVADQNPAEATAAEENNVEVNSAVKEPNTAEVATELEQHEEQQNVEKRTPEQEPAEEPQAEQEPAEEPQAEQEPAETEVSEQSQVDEQRSQPKNAEEAEEQKNAETNEEQQAQKSQNAEEERAQEPKTEQQTEEQ
ncbi:uncharacterized abhydrolase domain-containing protein DDB_G0269086-like [Penaeus monodon]|uniref:uncharacterized abhydrolase domain-containing protein DDB_G0269086-like n=1 Tax=Penaeus monodon TaxID=6687 RepID=UPI0018A7895E|nr:uncharacterized abhydrolase domain-containing protein DDB_G0269086-like [Penaeus monodon]